LILLIPTIFFFKPRYPTSPVRVSRRPQISFWTTRVFYISQIGNIIESLGYFLPSIYLPSYASSLGASPFLSTLTIILVNGAGCVGSIAMGMLVDRLHFSTCVLISTVGTAIAVLCLWGLAASLPVLYTFCIAYGLFAASWTSTWPGIMRDVTYARQGTDGGMVFASLAAGKGIGSVASGPLSQALLRSVVSWKAGSTARYGMVIIFTGITAMCGACSFIAKRAGWF
jgi:MFS family permease